MPLKNDRLLRALLGETVNTVPIWLMRQAGRYLPEYRAVRAKAGDFLTLCRTPELACEVTLQPLRRFELDAAILFSDILTIPDAMGLGLYFVDAEGPRFKKSIRTEQDIQALPQLQISTDLGYVMQAVQYIQAELNGAVPLIGFSGSPWTVAAYMIEGGSSKDFYHAKYMLYQQPELMHQLLTHLTQAITDYLNAQIQAGVQAVQIFDTWGGLLTSPAYQAFSLAYMQKIIAGLIREHQGQKIPVIVFTKGGGQWLEAIASSGCDAVSLDWATDIAQAKQRVGNKVALQGNLDPAILTTSPACIQQQVESTLQSFNAKQGYVFNLGHGITPNINPDHVKALVAAVHAF